MTERMRIDAVRRGSRYAAYRRNRHLARAAALLSAAMLMSAYLPPVFLLSFAVGAAAHECGHLCAFRLCGIRLSGAAVRPGGAVLLGDFLRTSYRAELFCAAAGPFVNIVLFFLANVLGRRPAADVNLLLAFYNLLPIGGHDGAVMLRSLGMMLGYPALSVRLCRVLSCICSLVLLMLAAWVFWYGAVLMPGGVMASGALFVCVLIRLLSAY